MARGIVLQTLLGLFFLSDLGQKIYRARSPSTEYTEYQLWFSHVHKPKPKVRPDCSFFGCILWFVLTWSGHCASSKVENRVEVAQIVWTEALRAKKEMEMFLFTCRNVSIPAGQRPGQCLDKTKQWRWVLGGESPWLCSHILEGCQECENPKLLKWRVMEQVLPEKNPKELSVSVWIRCFFCISQSRYFTFYFWLFWGSNSSDFQSEWNLQCFHQAVDSAHAVKFSLHFPHPRRLRVSRKTRPKFMRMFKCCYVIPTRQQLPRWHTEIIWRARIS